MPEEEYLGVCEERDLRSVLHMLSLRCDTEMHINRYRLESAVQEKDVGYTCHCRSQWLIHTVVEPTELTNSLLESVASLEVPPRHLKLNRATVWHLILPLQSSPAAQPKTEASLSTRRIQILAAYSVPGPVLALGKQQ